MDQFETPVVSSEDADQNVTIRRRRMLTLDPLDENEDGQENTTTGIDVPENQDEPEEEWENLSVRSARSNTSKSSSSGSGSRASDCWTDNLNILEGNSAAAQRGLVGATGSSGNQADILVASKNRIFSGLPISGLITKLNKKQNGKGDNANIAAIVADLEKERPDIITAILDVTTTSGSQARDKLLTAFDMLFNLTKSHRIIVHAILCYIWTMHPKSKLKDELSSIAQDYVLASNPLEVKSLLDSCIRGHAMNFLMSSDIHDVDHLPGIARLTLSMTMTNHEFGLVVESWETFWHCLCNYICKQDFHKAKLAQLDELLKQNDLHLSGNATEEQILKHRYVNKTHTMQQLHTMLQQQHIKISSCALQQNQQDRIPDAYARICTLMVAIHAAHPAIYHRLTTLIDNRDLNIDVMTYEVFVRLVFDAETSRSSTSSIIAFTLSLFNKKPKPLKDGYVKDGTVKDVSGEPPRPVYLVQGTHTYECLVGFPVTATDEDRKRALDAGKCTNCFCLKFKKYPNHLVEKCPFTQRDPERNPWPATHIPVPTQDGRPLRPSDPETIKVFLAARKTLLAGSSPKVAKTTPNVPAEPPRLVTCQPMLIEELPSDDTEEITVPADSPMKGPVQQTAWAASARTRTAHHMMFPMLSTRSRSSSSSSGSEDEYPDIPDIPPSIDYRVAALNPPPTVEMFLATTLGHKVVTGVDTFAEITSLRASVLQALNPCPIIQPSPILVVIWR